ncbi:MAG: hypothetical protein ACK583_15335 [Cyanobacteriota bacterium]|jgi:hypothetical protein
MGPTPRGNPPVPRSAVRLPSAHQQAERFAAQLQKLVLQFRRRGER